MTKKTKRLGIYTCLGKRNGQVIDATVYWLEKLREHVDELVIVSDIRKSDKLFNEVSELVESIIPSSKNVIHWAGDGYKLAFDSLGYEKLKDFDEVIMVDRTVYGPLFPLQDLFDEMDQRTCDFWSCTFFNGTNDKRFGKKLDIDLVLNWSTMVLRKPVLQSPTFEAFWRNLPKCNSYEKSFLIQEAGFTKAMTEAGFVGDAFIKRDQVQTTEPRIFEAYELIKMKCPVVHNSVFISDPMVHEFQSVYAKKTLKYIEDHTSYDIGLVWKSLLPNMPLRTLYTNLEQLKIIPDDYRTGSATEWSFGRIAVIVHAYYAEMIGEFKERFDCIPADFDIFISTASEESREKILQSMADFDRGEVTVKVVEQNRGRDMSSLFITFREELLGDKYGMALRLHSKRSPQVAHQVGQSFKDHLFENLITNKTYVANLFDVLEREPDIGMVIPPTIHIGFGTMGHAWFHNRAKTRKILNKLGINIPVDIHTPIAAYGTMFWFRPKALNRMFEHKWDWEEFNPEPHHVDGGLAHVFERLMTYCAQKDGYRTLSVFTPEMAERNYVKLEYKLQLLASFFPTGDIRHQVDMANAYKLAKKTGQIVSVISRTRSWLKRRTNYRKATTMPKPKPAANPDKPGD